MKTAIILVLSLVSFSYALDSKIIETIAIKETHNKTGAVGDLHMKKHSYGKYQIRQGYLDDVIKLFGKEFKQKFGKAKPTLKEVQWNDEMGKWIVAKYIGYYGSRYTKITGLPMTPQIAFMIHNGGPDGWKKGDPVYKGAYAYSRQAMSIYREIS